MYLDFFGFKTAPFSIAPDPQFLYMSHRHQEALAHLMYGVREEGGFVLLTGEVGTGKTTVCRCLLEQLPQQTDIAFIVNPRLSSVELLATICDEFGVQVDDGGDRIKPYLDSLYRFLLQNHAQGRNAVVIVDEAQNLTVPVLEQLRLLTNLETNDSKLLRIVLLGQPQLRDLLLHPDLEQLAQRITARYHLEPLKRPEVEAYVAHRLRVAGGDAAIIPAVAVRRLFALSNGIPRVINILCDRALMGAFSRNERVISRSLLNVAAKEVFGRPRWHEPGFKKQALYLGLCLGALVIGAVLTGSLYRPTDTQSMAAQEVATAKNPSESAGVTVSTETDRPQGDTEPSGDDVAATQPPEVGVDAFVVEEDIPPSATIALTEPEDTEEDPIGADQGDGEVGDKENVAQLPWDIKERDHGMRTAYRRMFSLWGYELSNSGWICRQAEAQGGRCLHRRGNLISLKRYNRPAVLHLRAPQEKELYVTLMSLADEHAVLAAEGSVYRMPLEELARYWTGKFALLWRPPSEYRADVAASRQPAMYQWAALQMDLPVDALEQDGDPKEILAPRLKKFQAERGLDVDGLLGPQTLVRLNELRDPDVPQLRR